MGWIIASIGRGFREVTRFEGRDSLAQYWPYALLLGGLEFIVGIVVGVMASISMITEAVHTAQSGIQPDQMAMQSDMMERMVGVMPFTIGLGLIVMALLAAATVRRLHDRDWSGWWIALPVGLRLFGAVSAPWTMRWAMNPEPGLHTLFGAVMGVINIAVFILLLVQLVQRGKPEDNRFGPAPAPGT